MALEPITRQEQIIAGKDLEPITRMERFLKEYGGGSGGGSGASVQADWNQNDETAADYVKNRTHYEKRQTLYEGTDLAPVLQNDGNYMLTIPDPPFNLANGNTYMVVINGVSYECVGYSAVAGAPPMIGNLAFAGGQDTGEPFFVVDGTANGDGIGILSFVEFNSISISETVKIPLPLEYLPVVTFYYNLDEYLYKDCVGTKVTADELLLVKDKFIRLQFAIVPGAISSYALRVVFDDGYGVVKALTTSDDIATYYTAEYTPKT